MPDQFCKDTVYIISKSARKYDVLQTQNGVVFKKRPTPSVLPDYVKPRPISKPAVIIPPKDKVVTTETRPSNIVNIKANQENTSIQSPISNSNSFEDLKRKVEELRKKEAEKKLSLPETSEKPTTDSTISNDLDDVAIVTMEDADELASGAISKEQELITKDYLKSLSYNVLKKVYYVCTGKKADKSISKFEMRRDILNTYEESNANRKKVIYEASRTSL